MSFYVLLVLFFFYESFTQNRLKETPQHNSNNNNNNYKNTPPKYVLAILYIVAGQNCFEMYCTVLFITIEGKKLDYFQTLTCPGISKCSQNIFEHFGFGGIFICSWCWSLHLNGFFFLVRPKLSGVRWYENEQHADFKAKIEQIFSALLKSFYRK